MEAITVVNIPKSESRSGQELGFDSGVVFKTCLRTLYIFNSPASKLNVSRDAEIYSNYEALEYIIKVISGLESPVLGETEVLGQFKEQVLAQLESNPSMRPLIEFVLSVTKLVRTKHLKDLGSQSYGSLVRRILKNENHVLFVGQGILAQSILPWISESRNCMFSVRNSNKFINSEIAQKFQRVSSVSFSEQLIFDFPLSLIVCAPVSAAAIEKHIKGCRVNSIIDLREDSQTDPIRLSNVKTYDLYEVFNEIKAKASFRDSILKKVKEDIDHQVQSRFVKHRPFGWEDLCT